MARKKVRLAPELYPRTPAYAKKKGRGRLYTARVKRPVDSLSLATLIKQSKKAYKVYLSRQGEILENLKEVG